jgi:hypothetical protein
MAYVAVFASMKFIPKTFFVLLVSYFYSIPHFLYELFAIALNQDAAQTIHRLTSLWGIT